MAASVIMTIVGIFAAASSRILADEVKAWSPRLTKRLIALAVRRLPENQRERYSEEWLSFIEEIPGEIGKVVAALGLICAGVRIGLASRMEGRAEAGARSERAAKERLTRAIFLFRRFSIVPILVGGWFATAGHLLFRQLNHQSPSSSFHDQSFMWGIDMGAMLLTVVSMTWSIRRFNRLLREALDRQSSNSSSHMRELREPK